MRYLISYLAKRGQNMKYLIRYVRYLIKYLIRYLATPAQVHEIPDQVPEVPDQVPGNAWPST